MHHGVTAQAEALLRGQDRPSANKAIRNRAASHQTPNGCKASLKEVHGARLARRLRDRVTYLSPPGNESVTVYSRSFGST